MTSPPLSDILARIETSLLLSDDAKVALRGRIQSLTLDTETLSRIGAYLDGERHFIVGYLREIVRNDTTNMAAAKIRDAMRRAYVQDLHVREQKDRQSESSGDPSLPILPL